MIEPKMVLVEGGTFMMGSSDGLGDQKPPHLVTLSSFYISQFLVTQHQWQSVMSTNPCKIVGNNLPVVSVSWSDVQEFLKTLNSKTDRHYRLPTEAEWEFAARGGIESRGFKYAGSDNLDEVAWYAENSHFKHHDVGLKLPNELGIYDMLGNIHEWCNDWHCSDYYKNSAQVDPKGPDKKTFRILRGGSRYSISKFCQITVRFVDIPDSHHDVIGFRLAHDFETF